MKICKKCKTKNDNRKKKCTYCGASLKNVKIKEDDSVYMSTYRGTHDIIEDELDIKEPEKLSKQFSTFVLVFFVLSSISYFIIYHLIDSSFIYLNLNSVVILFWSFVYRTFKNLALNYIIIILTLKIVFRKRTLYEDDINKFMKLVICYFIIFALYMAVFNYIIYENLFLMIITFIINLFTLIVYFPIILHQLKKKLL